MGSTEPLILAVDEDEDFIGQGASTVRPQRMKQLTTCKPDAIVAYVRDKGLYRLGEFVVNDSSALACFHDEEYLVKGLDTCNIDFKTFWQAQLGLHNKQQEDGVDNEMLNVTVEAYVVTIRDAAFPDSDGLVYNMLRMQQNHACSMGVFAIPALQAVINYKWNAFARKLLLLEFFVYVAWLVAFTTFTLYFTVEDEQLPLDKLMQTPNGPITVFSLLASLVFMAPFIFIEIATVTNYQGGWINVYNIMDITLYTLQITSAVVYFRRRQLDNQMVALGMAVQHVLMWFRIQYFSRVFKATRFSFVDSIQYVLVEIKWYLFFMALLWWGFGCAFHVLFREDTAYPGFRSLANSLVTIFCFSMGGSLPAQMQNKGSGWPALGLAMVFQFLMSMILMKLLIGLMTSAINKANRQSEGRWLLGKAEVVDELESTIPRFLHRYMKSFYPHYVHVLRINKTSVSAEEKKLIWGRPDQDAPPATPADAHPEPIATVTNAALAAHMAALQQQLSLLAGQLAALPVTEGDA